MPFFRFHRVKKGFPDMLRNLSALSIGWNNGPPDFVRFSGFQKNPRKSTVFFVCWHGICIIFSIQKEKGAVDFGASQVNHRRKEEKR